MTHTIQNIVNLTKQFEKLALQSLSFLHKKKKFSLLEELEMQLLDAQRIGDEEWARELKERIKEIKKDKDVFKTASEAQHRGKVVFPAESSLVKDKKDHFPINNANQARNALARANQYSGVPEWYKGSLQSLVNAVARAVKKHYPSIEVSKASKKPGKD